jgi:hypothetical protein
MWARKMLIAGAFGCSLTDSEAFHLAQSNRRHKRADESAYWRAFGSVHGGLVETICEVLRFHLGERDRATIRRRCGYLGRTNRQMAEAVKREIARANRAYAARVAGPQGYYLPVVRSYIATSEDARLSQADFLRAREMRGEPILEPARFAALVRELAEEQEQLARWRASIVRK